MSRSVALVQDCASGEMVTAREACPTESFVTHTATKFSQPKDIPRYAVAGK